MTYQERVQAERQEITDNINAIAPLMQEQYMRHDYRQMWELWQALLTQVGLISKNEKEVNNDL